MAIKFPRVQTTDRLLNQVQQNFAALIEPIFANNSGSFVTSLTGCTTDVSGTAIWSRATIDGPITIQFVDISGESNADSAFITGLPSPLWPATTQTMIVRTYENSALGFAIMTIGSDGLIQLYASVDSPTFTTSGTKGLAQSCVTYML